MLYRRFRISTRVLETILPILVIACVQTSPISFASRGKGTFSARRKGNRRPLHAGYSLLAMLITEYTLVTV